MRFMRWSFVDLLACPHDYVDVIVEQAKQEAAESRNAARQGGARRRR